MTVGRQNRTYGLWTTVSWISRVTVGGGYFALELDAV
jgi:hypothetical protein